MIDKSFSPPIVGGKKSIKNKKKINKNKVKIMNYPMSIKKTRAFLKRIGENSSYRAAVEYKKMMNRHALKNLYRTSIIFEKIIIERQIRKC